jgi:DNA primase
MPDAYAEIRALPLIAVLSSLGFSEWKSRKGDTEWFGKCPVHDAKRNTTSFSFDSEGKFNCFSCGSKGKGAIDIYMAVRKVGFQAAVDALKGFNLHDELGRGARKPEVRLLQLPVTENPPFKASYEKFYVPSEWLKACGLTKETLDRYGVGLYFNFARKSAYTDKVMFPIHRFADGAKVGYLARTPEPKDGEQKYIFPKAFAKHLELWGAYQLKEKAPIRVLYLVESPFTVMKFYQLGFDAASPFGWSVSPEQAAILSQLAKDCIYFPDRNKYQEAIRVAGELSQRLWVKMPAMPDGVDDPEQLTTDQIHALS